MPRAVLRLLCWRKSSCPVSIAAWGESAGVGRRLWLQLGLRQGSILAVVAAFAIGGRLLQNEGLVVGQEQRR